MIQIFERTTALRRGAIQRRSDEPRCAPSPYCPFRRRLPTAPI